MPLPRSFIAALAIASCSRAASGQDSTLRGLEHRGQGRLGVFVIHVARGKVEGYRPDERFPLLSTFKLPLVMATLARVDSGTEHLDREMVVPPSPLLPNSPITEQHGAGGRIAIGELCMAAIRYSDNTAANMLLSSLGGPASLTGRLRTWGDTVFRLDRTEPTLNESRRGDDRDTSTPRATAALLRRLVSGAVLSDASRRLIDGWLRTNTTGDARFRAGVPAGWAVADKTGTMATGANDIGVLYPNAGGPVIVVAYLTQSAAPAAVRDSVLAAIAALAVRDEKKERQ